MNKRGVVIRRSPAVLLVLALAASLHAQQSFLIQLQAEHDPGKRSDKALIFANDAFESARAAYIKGEIRQGDTHLEDMTNVLNQCLEALDAVNKGRYYKKAEIRVATLLRRMQGLIDDLNAEDRGWAEYTHRKLDEIHDQLLKGVMKK
jgi:hypothetical protein